MFSLDAISAMVDKQTDEMCDNAGQLSLGELQARLEPLPSDLPVKFSDDGQYPSTFMSYRGYYRFIAVGRTDDVCCTVHGLLARIAGAIGQTFTGYKGGDFPMTRRTPVWVSNYGEASGDGVVGVEANNDQATLIVKRIEDDE